MARGTKRLLTTTEVGRELGIHPTTVRKLLEKGTLRGEKYIAEKRGFWLVEDSALTPEIRSRYEGGQHPKGGRPRVENPKRPRPKEMRLTSNAA